MTFMQIMISILNRLQTTNRISLNILNGATLTGWQDFLVTGRFRFLR